MNILRKNILVGLLVSGIILLSGYFVLLQLKNDEIAPNDNLFQHPDYSNLPWEVRNWIEKSKEMFLSQKYLFEGNSYILVTWGRKPTAGYSVVIRETFKERGKLIVNVLFEEPPSDSMVAQVITYPYDLIVYDDEIGEIEFRGKGAEEYLPTLVGLPHLKAIYSQSENIILFEPSFSGSKKRSIYVEGIARVFEATYQYRIVDFIGETVISGFSMAKAGGPDWGYFDLSLTLPETASPGEYSLEVFTYSPKDGSKQDTVRVVFNIE